MTKRQALWRLLEMPLYLLGGVIVGNVFTPTFPNEWGERIRFTGGDLTLSQSQAVLLAAALTGVVGLLGSWSVKAREFRNARADRVAEIALEFHALLSELFDLIVGAKVTFDDATKRMREIVSEVEALERSKPSLRLVFGESSTEHKAADARLETLTEESKEISKGTRMDAIEQTIDRFGPAKARLRMYASWDIAFFASEAANACVEFFHNPRDEVFRDEAESKIHRLLDESRISVTVMRRWWGLRAAHTIRVFAEVRRYGEAFRVLFSRGRTSRARSR